MSSGGSAKILSIVWIAVSLLLVATLAALYVPLALASPSILSVAKSAPADTLSVEGVVPLMVVHGTALSIATVALMFVALIFVRGPIAGSLATVVASGAAIFVALSAPMHYALLEAVGIGTPLSLGTVAALCMVALLLAVTLLGVSVVEGLVSARRRPRPAAQPRRIELPPEAKRIAVRIKVAAWAGVGLNIALLTAAAPLIMLRWPTIYVTILVAAAFAAAAIGAAIAAIYGRKLRSIVSRTQTS